MKQWISRMVELWIVFNIWHILYAFVFLIFNSEHICVTGVVLKRKQRGPLINVEIHYKKFTWVMMFKFPWKFLLIKPNIYCHKLGGWWWPLYDHGLSPLGNCRFRTYSILILWKAMVRFLLMNFSFLSAILIDKMGYFMDCFWKCCQWKFPVLLHYL